MTKGLRVPKRMKQAPTASHRRAPKQEREAAARLGGRVVKGSGCGPERGDVRVKGVLRLENKCTKNKSFSVTREMLQKIESAALASDELPALQIEFLDDRGNVQGRVCVVPDYVLDMIVESRSAT